MRDVLTIRQSGYRWALLAILSCLLLAPMAFAQTMLKEDDRVVIYGDSITEQRIYSRYLQQYLYCRYPQLKLHFYNAGWGGDTAAGAADRLERDVLSLKPTVVTLFFGMNDGRYQPLNSKTAEWYRSNLEKIITTLQAKGVRVVVFTPGCVDDVLRKDFAQSQYNKTLEALAAIAMDLARKYNCPSVDVYHPLLKYSTEHKAQDPAFTIIPDGIHPDPRGHLVMTRYMLQGFGAEAMPAMGQINLTTGQGQGIRLVSKDDSKIVLETTGSRNVPFWFDPILNTAMRDSGLLDFAGQKIAVQGLTANRYALAFNGADIGSFTKDALAQGVPVAGFGSNTGRFIHDLIQRKENSYFTAWREVKLGLKEVSGGVQPIVDNLMAADENFQTIIQRLSTPVTDKSTLTLTALPGGANLAQDKNYKCSDPNTYGWNPGLTDGSWQEGAGRCFATGKSNVFPKHVTVDLETPAQIKGVLVGVPPFGSTRTIKVSVSADGQRFTDVGSYVFSQRKAERHAYHFAPVSARYVRLTYVDHYDQVVSFDANFAFTSEVEVYDSAE